MSTRCPSISHIVFSEANCELCSKEGNPQISHSPTTDVAHEDFTAFSPRRSVECSALSSDPLSPPRSIGTSPQLGPLCSITPGPLDMSPVSPPRLPGPSCAPRCCPHRGMLFLGNVHAMFALGSGENVHNIGAVLSCLPEVNEDVSTFTRKAKIDHHSYFHLDDNDAFSIRLDNASGQGCSVGSTSGSNPMDSNIFHRFQEGPALRSALEFIHSNRLAERNVLVHCDGGVLRSPATVISYLMAHVNMTMVDACATVKRCRSVVSLRVIEDSLHALEQSLQSCSLSHRSAGSTASYKSSFDSSASGANPLSAPGSRIEKVGSKIRTDEAMLQVAPSSAKHPWGNTSDDDDDNHPAQQAFEMPVCVVPHSFLTTSSSAPSSSAAVDASHAVSGATQQLSTSYSFATGCPTGGLTSISARVSNKPSLSVRID